jgi:hypothetical protein
MTSPCGKIRIPINEEGNEKPGQIQEYLDMYHGEGIQHIALGSDDLSQTVDAMRASGVKLLDTIDTYYELVDKRIPGHGQDVAELRQRKILIDGKAGELLLQIFSENQLGPIFFEFIQRKGDQGFGEGNFKALFESIELDQMRRGVLPKPGRSPRRSTRVWPRSLTVRAAARPAATMSGRARTTAANRPMVATRSPTTTRTGACMRAKCSSCRAWPAMSSLPRCNCSGRPNASPTSMQSPSD